MTAVLLALLVGVTLPTLEIVCEPADELLDCHALAAKLNLYGREFTAVVRASGGAPLAAVFARVQCKLQDEVLVADVEDLVAARRRRIEIAWQPSTDATRKAALLLTAALRTSLAEALQRLRELQITEPTLPAPPVVALQLEPVKAVAPPAQPRIATSFVALVSLQSAVPSLLAVGRLSLGERFGVHLGASWTAPERRSMAASRLTSTRVGVELGPFARWQSDGGFDIVVGPLLEGGILTLQQLPGYELQVERTGVVAVAGSLATGYAITPAWGIVLHARASLPVTQVLIEVGTARYRALPVWLGAIGAGVRASF